MTKTFKRVETITLTMYKLDFGKDGAPKSHFLKIKGFEPHVSKNPNAQGGYCKSECVNLVTGEHCAVFVHESLANKLEGDFDYEIVVSKPEGKRYPEYSIFKVQVA